eukprot:7432455-Alexandrium_andersonii.AAC.1
MELTFDNDALALASVKGRERTQIPSGPRHRGGTEPKGRKRESATLQLFRAMVQRTRADGHKGVPMRVRGGSEGFRGSSEKFRGGFDGVSSGFR